MKIRECDSESAVKIGKSSGCFVAKWRDKEEFGSQSKSATPTCSASTLRRKLRPYFKLLCWNYRGLSSSLPYIESLIESGSKVLCLSEHWLWPFEMHKLNEVNSEY